MSTSTHFDWYTSPIGEILLTANERALTGLHLLDRRSDATIEPGWIEGGAVLEAARAQLEAYFAGKSRTFDVPMDPGGTPFQRRVWDELCKIPYSETISYAELARRIGKAGAARAVGGANGRNPIGIIVPCHRVVAAGGSLGGYGGGLDRKLWLLQHEAETLGRDTPASWTASVLASPSRRAAKTHDDIPSPLSEKPPRRSR